MRSVGVRWAGGIFRSKRKGKAHFKGGEKWCDSLCTQKYASQSYPKSDQRFNLRWVRILLHASVRSEDKKISPRIRGMPLDARFGQSGQSCRGRTGRVRILWPPKTGLAEQCPLFS